MRKICLEDLMRQYMAVSTALGAWSVLCFALIAGEGSKTKFSRS